MIGATTVHLRNPRTVGTCGAPGCSEEARKFACGWRCVARQPGRHLRAVRP